MIQCVYREFSWVKTLRSTHILGKEEKRGRIKKILKRSGKGRKNIKRVSCHTRQENFLRIKV